MKKIIMRIKLVIILAVSLFWFPYNPKANEETLQDLIDKLNVLEQKINKNIVDKELTEEKIKNTQNNIIKLGFNIKDTESNIIKLQKEIVNYEEEIGDKDAEIKKLINFLQLTKSENMYLEYIFGSSSLTDFIYRFSIIERLTEYNESLINDMSNKVVEKNKKGEMLKGEKLKLEQREKELAQEQEKLGKRINFLDEDTRSLEDEIEDARKTIDNYKKLGCRPNDILEVCSKIPEDSNFLRPLNQGVITSSYGIRDNPLSPGNYVWHYSIDIGGNRIGTPVYPTAAGRVVLVRKVKQPEISNSSCGGNYVVIQHNIDGIYYASRYVHLSELFVVENQKVTNNTVIGSVGGGEEYDRCSTGPHLDFSIARGIYSKDFYYFRGPYTTNPVVLINFPNENVWYNDRYEKY